MIDPWMNASVAPPDEWIAVLGYSAHMGYAIALYCGCHRWQDEDGNPLTVSHWQSLPAEPK